MMHICPLTDRPHQPEWTQRLGVAVIRQAIVDVRSRSLHSTVRTRAAAFLNDSAGFRYWCMVIGCDSSVLLARLTKQDLEPIPVRMCDPHEG